MPVDDKLLESSIDVAKVLSTYLSSAKIKELGVLSYDITNIEYKPTVQTDITRLVRP